MSENFNLEVPEFAYLGQRCAPDPAACNNIVCNDCCKIANDTTCRNRFGLNNIPVNPVPNCVCHDVCVKEVTHICAKPFDFELSYPPIGICRAGLPSGTQFPTLPPNQVCKVVVTCAEEILSGSCTCITLRVGLMILCGTGTNVVAIPTCITVHCNATEFAAFPSCVLVPDAEFFRTNIIPEIDGSCVVVQVGATTNDAGNKIRIRGKIIDKLWRHENLWLVGLRPYGLNDTEKAEFRSITVENIFTTQNHFIGPCNDILCPPCTAPNSPCSG